MIYLTELETILITCLPALTSIVSIITAVKVIINSLATLKDNKEIKAERDALVEQNRVLVAECKKMTKQTALLIQKASHIVYEDLSEVKNDKDLQV